MSEPAAGRIIPFPQAKEPPLSALLARVDVDLTAQRESLTDWRGLLASRRDTGTALSRALMDYRAQLADLDARLVQAARSARQLEIMVRLAEEAGVDDPFMLLPPRSRRD